MAVEAKETAERNLMKAEEDRMSAVAAKKKAQDDINAAKYATELAERRAKDVTEEIEKAKKESEKKITEAVKENQMNQMAAKAEIARIKADYEITSQKANDDHAKAQADIVTAAAAHATAEAAKVTATAANMKALADIKIAEADIKKAEAEKTTADAAIVTAATTKAQADIVIAEAAKATAAANIIKSQAEKAKAEIYSFEEKQTIQVAGPTVPVIKDKLMNSFFLGKIFRQETQVHVANEVTTLQNTRSVRHRFAMETLPIQSGQHLKRKMTRQLYGSKRGITLLL